MRSVSSGRGMAIAATCALLVFAAPAGAKAGTGADKARGGASGAKEKGSKRGGKHRYSDHQYVQLATARMGFCVEVDPVSSGN